MPEITNNESSPKTDKLNSIADKLLFSTIGNESTQNHSISSTLSVIKAEENMRLSEYRNTMNPSIETKLLMDMAKDQQTIATSYRDIVRSIDQEHQDEFDNTAKMTFKAYSQATELGFNASDLQKQLLELKPTINRTI